MSIRSIGVTKNVNNKELNANYSNSNFQENNKVDLNKQSHQQIKYITNTGLIQHIKENFKSPHIFENINLVGLLEDFER